MKLPFWIVALFVGLALSVEAEDFSGKSPSGKLGFESREMRELYLWKTEKPKARVLLYKEQVVFIQAAMISPDDYWIALEQGGASLGHTILFFRRLKGLEFTPAELPFDLTEKVGSFALATKGIRENILDHSYLRPVAWSRDSKSLVLAIDAKGSLEGRPVRLKEWQCRYDMARQTLSLVEGNPGTIEIGVRGSTE